MKFRAHDTFFIRKGWLSKGMKAVHSKPDVFVAKDENPMDVLGIGSNMVKSLRYWLVATNLTEEALLNKRRVQKFTGFGNQIFKNDRYMEEYGTLYLMETAIKLAEENKKRIQHGIFSSMNSICPNLHGKISLRPCRTMFP